MAELFEGCSVEAQGVLVTPELASQFLSKTPDYQRNLRPNKVNQLAGDMEQGLWELNGETVIIANDGSLIDGQHRMAAVVKSGETVPMVIIKGVSPEAFKTIDRGMPRRVSDAFRGKRHAATIASIGKQWASYDKDRKIVWLDKDLSSVQVQEYCIEHMDELEECCKRFMACRNALGGTLSSSGYGVFEIAHIRKYGTELTACFAEELAKGVESSNPAVQTVVRMVMQGRLGTDGGQARVMKTAQLLSYAFEKWLTKSGPIKKCYFENYDLSKLDV